MARIGEQLVAAGLISQDALEQALAQQRRDGGFLSDVLVLNGFADEAKLLRFLAERAGQQYVTSEKLAKAKLEDVVERLPVQEAEQWCVMPVAYDGESETLVLAVPEMIGPSALEETLSAVERVVPKVVPILALNAAIRAAIRRFYYGDIYAFAPLQQRLARGSVGKSQANVAVLARSAVVKITAKDTSPAATGEDEAARLKETVSALRKENLLLRVTAELGGHLARIAGMTNVLHRVLAYAFDIFPAADEGAVLLQGDEGQLEVKAVQSRVGEQTQVVVADTLLAEATQTKRAVLAAGEGTVSSGATVAYAKVPSAMVVPLEWNGGVRGALAFNSSGKGGVLSTPDLEVLTAIANQTSATLEAELVRERVAAELLQRSNLNRFFSPALAEQAATGAFNLDVARFQPVTVLAVNICGFTELSRSVGPTLAINLLNQHFNSLTEMVFSNGGAVDRLVGDTLFAVWGLPSAKEHDASRAVRCALDMVVRSKMMNQVRQTRGLPTFDFRAGLCSGEALFGAVGPAQRFDLTVLGDTVVSAARLASRAEREQVLCDGPTLDRCPDEFISTGKEALALRGRPEPLPVFLVTGDT